MPSPLHSTENDQVVENDELSSLPASSSTDPGCYFFPTSSIGQVATDIRRSNTYSHMTSYRPRAGRRASTSHRYTVDNFHNQLPSCSPPFGECTALPVTALQPLQPGMDPRLFYSMSISHPPGPPPPIVMLPPPQANAPATNYVALARKNTVKRPTFSLRRKIPNVSSITGKFNIDPSLKVPPSLLTSREPGQQEDSALPGRASSSQGMKQRKNLSLEIENGGIDVDINLVSCTANKSRRLSTLANLDNHPERPPSSLSLAHTASGQLQSNLSASLPTLIDLRLKRSGVKNRTKDFSLVARIHAPNPRQPFHLLASAMDIDFGHNKSTFHPLTPNNTYSIRDALRQAEVEVDLSVNRPSKSDISLDLPRTFHGPLTVFVAVGDIDQHVRLSSGIREVAVLLSEDAFSRTYFIGDLGLEAVPDSNFAIVAAGAEGEEAEEAEEVTSIPSLRSDFESRPAGASFIANRVFSGTTCTPPESNLPPSRVQARTNPDLEPTEGVSTWLGDRIDVVVGRGRINLQFSGELSELKSRKRLPFWKSIFRGSNFPG
ncbi:hypothetical protein D9613_008315 [Agrocybe pediades]|uniref:DUF7330 domain-containing protein n=1 Tax=Agrocybe pediades TaxID=84607 RepID=A0A8H4QS40_9AGAR|nr:hypothetical protein D9613_008315 [Agrocybe pediades]